MKIEKDPRIMTLLVPQEGDSVSIKNTKHSTNETNDYPTQTHSTGNEWKINLALVSEFPTFSSSRKSLV